MAQVVHIITGLGQGGAEGVLYRLLAASRDRERFAVISLQDEGVHGEHIRALGVPVHVLGMRPGRIGLRDLWRLVRLLRRLHPQLVQTWLYHADLLGGVAARLAGIRRVFWGIRNSDIETMHARNSTRAVVWACARLSGWVAEAIVSCSRRAVGLHQAAGYRGKFVVIANGYDLSRLVPDAAVRDGMRAAWGVPQDGTVFGHVGRFDPKKDQRNFVVAAGLVAKQAPQARFVMCGTGIDAGNDELTQLARQVGIAERLLLLGPRHDISAVMNGLDLLVLSSAFGEAFPNVVAEAMACGTPCVVTDVGDAAEIVGDSGWVVPPRDAASLAEAMLSALSEDEAQWQRRKTRARRRIVENYDIETMVARYEQLWTEHA